MTKSDALRDLVRQMMDPPKNLPFGDVIEALSGCRVIPFDPEDERDRQVLQALRECAGIVEQKVNEEGIAKKRVNEVGIAIEPYVKEALRELGFHADTPRTAGGKKKSAGYPDLEFTDSFGRLCYLECKTYNRKNLDTAQRSFYVSPSDDFKVTGDAHHFGISFEIYTDGKTETGDNIYKIAGWKIMDLYSLRVDVKFEFNSDNKRLYDQNLILAQKG